MTVNSNNDTQNNAEEQQPNNNEDTGGNTGGSGTVQQPVKIFTTLNISGERFETVTQDALINLQKQGKKILI